MQLKVTFLLYEKVEENRGRKVGSYCPMAIWGRLERRSFCRCVHRSRAMALVNVLHTLKRQLVAMKSIASITHIVSSPYYAL